MLSSRDIKELLEQKAQQFNSVDFISTDPIQVLHNYSDRRDIEIMGFLMATIAWGNRKMIIKNGRLLESMMDFSPYEYIMNYTKGQASTFPFVHRTFNAIDLDFFCSSLQNIYTTHGSLEQVFHIHPHYSGIKGRIITFREAFLSVEHPSRSEKHLSNPLKNSAAKRINMFLRWMVRNDEQGVDFGIWKSIQPSELYLPLDVHTGKIARKLGILHRKQDDWKALEEIMQVLREFDPVDPVKYDFALFGLGAFEKF